MNAAYLLFAIVGTGLVLASLFGSIDHDAPDFDHNLDGHAGLDSGHFVTPVFSPRFWIFSGAAFGLIGTTLTLVDAGGFATRLLAAIVGGFTTGMLVWLLFRLTSRVNTYKTSSIQLAGAQATVTVAIRGNSPGKIRTQFQGQLVEVLATTDEGEELLAGAEVFIVSMSGQYAEVIGYDTISGPQGLTS